jgi:hypothetical protein
MFRFQWFYPFPRLFLLTLPIMLRAIINIRPVVGVARDESQKQIAAAKAQAEEFFIQDGQVEAAWNAKDFTITRPSPDHVRG